MGDTRPQEPSEHADGSRRRRRSPQLFATLRYRNFRLYWMGLVAQVTGQQMTMVTLGWLAYDLTGSPLALGYVNLAQAVPQIVLNILGGALADRVDQRRLISLAQIVSGTLLVITAVLTVTGWIAIWQLVVLSFLLGMARSLDEPSRHALFPHLLPDRSLIPSAVPLMSMAWQLNRIMAPAIAGFVIAAAGAGMSFFLAAAGAAMMVIMLRLLRVQRVVGTARGNVLTNIGEGARYAWDHRVFRVVIGTCFLNAVLVMGYTLMMPLFAAVHDVGALGLGVMYSVTGVGSIASLFAVAPLTRAFPVGRVVAVAIVGFPLAMIAFALAPVYPLALAMLVAVGFFLHLFLAGAQIVLQSLVPDQLRGRVMGLYGMMWSVMPLGGALLNGVAQITGAPVALAGGASLMLLFVLLVTAPSRSLRDVVLPNAPPEQAG